MGDAGRNSSSSPRLIESFVADLESENPDHRTIAARELGERGKVNEAILAGLRDMLDDPFPLAEISAAHALYKLTGRADDVVPVLLEHLDTDDLDTSVSALIVLGEIGPEAQSAIPTLKT